MQILDFSQVLMYEFHYDDVKIKHGSNSRLLFTDTDTLMYKIKTKVFMKILVRIKTFFILVVIHLSQSIIVIQTNWLLVR